MEAPKKRKFNVTDIDHETEKFLRGVELGKRMYDRERRPEDPSWDEAEYRVRSVYIACAVKHARSANSPIG